MLEQEAREVLFKKAEQVYNKHNKVLMQFATGAGKTKAALDLVGDVLTERWTVLVPRLPLFDTWKEEIAKWQYINILDNLDFLCYASAHKLPIGNNNVILDEAHRVTENNLPYIKAFLGTGKLICLSATVPLEKRQLLFALGIDTSNTLKYSLDQAVKDNLVADYNIKVIQFPLDNTVKNIKAGKKGKYFMVTEQQGYIFQEQKVKQVMYSSRPDAIKWAILGRMRFIYNLPGKLELTKVLLSKIPTDKRVIIFCGSIAHANLICKHRFHSKTTDKDYKAFCEGKLNRLAVVQTIAEGVNIPEVDYAIIMQVQSKDLHTIQKAGRIVRKTKDPDKTGNIIILEATGTQDTKWVQSAIKTFDPTKIDYMSNMQLLAKGL